MNKNDFEFDQIKYLWAKSYSVAIYGRSISTYIYLLGNEGVDIEDRQIDAVNDFIEHQDVYIQKLEQGLLKYYRDNLFDIRTRFIEDADIYAPVITDKNKLAEVIPLHSVLIPDGCSPEKITVGFTFFGNWDTSHDIGGKFENRDLVEIGEAEGMLY